MTLERFSLERLRLHCKNLVCMPKIADFRTLLYEITKLAPLHHGHKSLPAFTAWLVENVLGFSVTLCHPCADSPHNHVQ